jgi:tetratricopeptide (TPR) repeat protein
VGRYNEVVDMARRSLDSMSGNGAEELYYWLGMGYAGRGQLNLAKEQLERAIAFKPDYQPAITALEQIISGTYQPPV